MSDKSKLELLSKEHEAAVESELESLKEKGKTFAVNTLFIIGGLALSYLAFRIITDEVRPKSKKKNNNNDDHLDQEPSFLSGFTQKIATEATIVLLALAKDKLSQYLKKGEQQDGDTSATDK